MHGKWICTLMAAMLLMTIPAAAGLAGAVTTQEAISDLITSLREEPSAQINWEVEVPAPVDESLRPKQDVFSRPDADDPAQVEALRLALETVFALTDKTPADIYNGYAISFFYGTENGGAGRTFWRVRIEVAVGKMGSEGYSVDISAPGGKVIAYWVNPS